MDRKEMLKRLKAGEDPLEVSILKWEQGEYLGESWNCALCETNHGCRECIIFKATGNSCSYTTPFKEYTVARIPRDAEGMEKARLAEVEFLKSLRKTP